MELELERLLPCLLIFLACCQQVTLNPFQEYLVYFKRRYPFQTGDMFLEKQKLQMKNSIKRRQIKLVAPQKIPEQNQFFTRSHLYLNGPLFYISDRFRLYQNQLETKVLKQIPNFNAHKLTHKFISIQFLLQKDPQV